MRALKSRPNRGRSGEFVAEGVRVVEDLLTSGVRPLLVVSTSSLEDSPRGRSLLSEISRLRIVHRTVTDADFLTFASTDSPQGVLAVAPIPTPTLADITRAPRPAVALLLDGVQDPGNFGTLIRSAEAFAAAGVIALPGTVDPWNPKAVRAAVGSSFRIPIVQCSWAEARDAFRAAGFLLVGADREGEPLSTIGGEAVGLVVGNEGGGLSPPVRADLDGLVGIPIRGRAESLNVGTAAAILLYELTRGSP